MLCKYCNSDKQPILKSCGPHIGAYCSNCGKWIKWLSKKAANILCDGKKVRVSSLYGEMSSSPVQKIKDKTTEIRNDDTPPWED